MKPQVETYLFIIGFHCIYYFLLKAFSEFLGNKPFLFGEKPSIADASLFGFLAEILSTHDEDNWLRKAIEDDFKVQSSPVHVSIQFQCLKL